MEDSFQKMISSIQRSHMLRLLLVGFLVLLLQIPIAMISGLITERQKRHNEAVEEVTGKWGKVQIMTGPALIIPYKHRWTEIGAKGQQVVQTKVLYATFLPDRLQARGKIESEVRYRGIFSVPVYRIRLDVEGEFPQPSFSAWGIDPANVVWDQAQLFVGISDSRAIQAQTNLTWNGQQIAFLPGVGDFGSIANAGIHVPLRSELLQAKRFIFSFPLTLNGSKGAYFIPFGRDTVVNLKSNWQSPSFQGNWLPSDRTISLNGFEATWKIPFLGRNYPQAWTSVTDIGKVIETSRFGVDLIVPVDEYRMSERSVKYAGLFILLTFACLWLIEVLAKVRIHPVQYLLLGAAMCIFYLLELSLSEHIGFGIAYVMASIAVVAMITTYSKVILKNLRQASIIGIVVAALYGYLYVLLRNEDYALLIGSIGLFVILGLIMFLTRQVNWYGAKIQEESLSLSEESKSQEQP
jgi:inner membrane protein